MKVIFFTNSDWAIPTLTWLKNENKLEAVVSAKVSDGLNPNIEIFCTTGQIEIMHWGNIEEVVAGLKNHDYQMGLMLGFKDKISKKVLEQFTHGIINIHFGELPLYAGPDPLFWILKEGRKQVRVTAHKINEKFDEGLEVLGREVPVFPGEPYGVLGGRLSHLIPSLLPEIFSKIEVKGLKRISSNPKPKSKPNSEDIMIRWKDHTSEEVENLVNACNPAYGGAITFYKGAQLRILEVSPADLENQGIFSAGGIVYSDSTYGIFVLCSDFKCLRVNLLKLEGAYISSQKFAALGVKAHERFE
ncbi:methionyl-tRNA formyltransferase [Algoriphagus namhaensis]|uniref:Methionyl-tRNA formyltransferase n=1 Tax=Algoriphagus namhaensis TaxID=915353 RepID=A0ABV8AT67_9BACT